MSADRDLPGRGVYAGILLCSMAVLMLEILLTRIFSFSIWYHLAYLTVSTALLGFGAAGSLLALYPRWLERDPARLAALCAASAGFSLLLCLAVLAPRPLDPDRVLTQPLSFSLGLFSYYALVCVPFLLAGFAVATPLAAHPARAGRLYAADLLGAGLGCLAAVLALTWLDGAAAIFVCAATFVAAAVAYASPRRLAWGLALAAVLLLALTPLAARLLPFRPAASKSLGQVMDHPTFEPHFTRWSPVNRVDVFSTALRGGFWHAHGVSPHYVAPQPRFAWLVYDAHNGSDVIEARGRESLRVLDHHILGAPYLLRAQPRVLVIGVGGGIDVLNALYHGAARVTGVELQPITVELHRGLLADWTGGWMQRPEVELVAAEGRHYVRSHPDERYQILQMTLVDTFSAQSTGAYVLAESYLYTVEAFEDYLSRLTDDGLISVVMGDLSYSDPAIPPPFSTRLCLIAREALERSGARDPGSHIVLIGREHVVADANSVQAVRGSWVYSLLVAKRPFSPEELARLRGFSERNGFSLRVAPDGSAPDSPVQRIVHAPREALGSLLDAQIFSLEPISDDRPFFFHVLPWRELGRADTVFWQLPGSATGQTVLLLMLAQAVLVGGALIGLPLWRQPSAGLGARATLGFLLYFLGLGVGFLMIEISFVQKYVLLLGYPTYSLSVTIFSLLVFASLGALLSRRGWQRPVRLLLGALAATLFFVVLEVMALPALRDRMLAAPLALRIALTVLLQLPIGVTLGLFFPTGLELLRRVEPRLIPWAWAVNGIGSVAAAVLAALLGVAIGFTGVALIAAGIYAVGTLALLLCAPRECLRARS